MSSTRLALALLLPTTRTTLTPLSTRSLSAQRRPRPSSSSGVSSFGLPTSPIDFQRRDETPFYKPRSPSAQLEDDFGLSDRHRTTAREPESPRKAAVVETWRDRQRASSASPLSSPRNRNPPTTHPYSSNYRGPLHPTWKDADSSSSSTSSSHPFNSSRGGFLDRGREVNPRGRAQPPAGAGEDLSIPARIRHPNYGKEVPLERGGFNLGPRVERDVVGREREKEEGVEEPVLTLHINSLPVEITAQEIYPSLMKAGLKVSTCEAIVDGYRSTAVVELESDIGVREALKKLVEGMPVLKNKIEITGNLDTVSDIFTPSKRRLAISNIPLYSPLPSLAHFLHASGIHNIEALQLVRHKGETNHSGLGFLWTREEQVRRLVGRELIFEGSRLIVGVAQDEPIPSQTNKSDWINGPAMKIRPSKIEKPERERRA